MTTPPILVADLGGTNARFALAVIGHDGVSLSTIQRLPTRNYASLEAAIDTYLKTAPETPEAACFAVAGPVSEGLFHFTNLDWSFDRDALSTRFGWRQFGLVNDFAAMALGAVKAPPADRAMIAPGATRPAAPVIVMGPGTGLGLATLVPANGDWTVLPSEGGHAAYAPQTERECWIWAKLAERLGYVPAEAVASATGLALVYQALGGAELSAEDIVARAPQDARAAEALAVFFAALGVFAGNAALTAGARGGVLLCGGMLIALEATLRESAFVSRFRARGLMSAYLADAPVTLIKDEHAALRGAALFLKPRDQ
jgi:glucokinase